MEIRELFSFADELLLLDFADWFQTLSVDAMTAPVADVVNRYMTQCCENKSAASQDVDRGLTPN
jgi:hypothetical protein